jgi:OHCU decarboxylase
VTLDELNALGAAEAEALFVEIGGARRWAAELARRRPFGHIGDLLETSDEIWLALGPADWREAFAHHPRIGERKPSGGGEAGARSAAWSASEQRGASAAASDARERLVEVNCAYEARFGYIFLIAAAGRTAEEILANARARLGNDPETELLVARDEQRKITWLRLERLLGMAWTRSSHRT